MNRAGLVEMQQKRLATFDFPKDETDDQALERAWNSFSDALRLQGLRPSEFPIRSTETSVTFRVFVIEHEMMEHGLNFDMTWLGAMVAAVFTGGGFFASYVLGLLGHAGGVVA